MSLPVLGYVSMLSTSLPVVSGFITRKRNSVIENAFLFYSIFSLLFEGLNLFIGIHYENNLWMFQVFLLCDFLFFSWYFHRAHQKPLWDIRFNAAVLLLITFAEMTAWLKPHFNYYLSWFHGLIFLFFVVQATYSVIATFEEEQGEVFHRPVFWVSFARMFYFLSLIFVFVFPVLLEMSIKSEAIGQASDLINYFSNISLNICYSISFLCLRLKK